VAVISNSSAHIVWLLSVTGVDIMRAAISNRGAQIVWQLSVTEVSTLCGSYQ
jgi:hypothetical protein